MDLLVVEPLPEEVLVWLSARQTVHYAPHWAQDRAALRLALRHVRGLVLPDSVPVDARLLRLAPGLRVIGRVAGGMEQIDHEACERVGVQLVRAEQATAQAEAEFALAAILQMLRRVPVPDADGVPVGREVQGLCLGLVGITPAVVPLARLFSGLGATLVGYDPALRVDDVGWVQAGVKPLPLADVVSRATRA
jgi:D-3-phosphoglycerate dehydrogenase / 2-oxoglutarate reductase